MFGNTTDRITELEGRANESLGIVDTFIQQLEDADTEASMLEEDCGCEIDRLTSVKSKARRVRKFCSAIMKVTK